ncbi:hypothetical protein CR513_43150, partial [Mucuna pruriens]
TIRNELNFIISYHTWELVDFPRVTKVVIVCALIALAAIHNLITHQIDAKTIFYIETCRKSIYIKQLADFIIPRQEYKVSKLKKSLYVVNEAKEFLSSKFEMKDQKEVINVILGIKIKCGKSRQPSLPPPHSTVVCRVRQTHYVKKLLRKFNSYYVILVGTPYDPNVHYKKNSKTIVCLNLNMPK